MSSTQELVARGAAPAVMTETPVPNFSFQDMQRMAVAIAKSGLFGVKDPDQALSLMMVAQAEGKHPALIARDYDIIQNRPAKKSEAILRDFQASGGRVEWHQRDDKMASATFSHPFAVKPVKIEWDIPRAKQAGLMDKNGGMYTKYPRQMLSSRCISEGCRAIAPSATSGFYSPEEIRDIDPAPTEPVSITAAITQAAAAPDPNEVEGFVNSMDVATLPALQAAFEGAWKSTKHLDTRARYKACYESMKQAIAEAQKLDVAAEASGS
jgi:hypothetical protein